MSTTYKGLAGDARPGDRLLTDNGRVGLVVAAADGDDVRGTVTEASAARSPRRAGVQRQGSSLPA